MQRDGHLQLVRREREDLTRIAALLGVLLLVLPAPVLAGEPAPQSPQAVLQQALQALEHSLYAQAEKQLTAVLRRVRHTRHSPGGAAVEVRALCALSRLAWERLRIDDAIRHAHAAGDLAATVGDGPGEFLARTRELRALYERPGMRALAWDLLARLEDRDRSALEARTAVEFYTVRGLLHRARGHWDLARKNFDEAVRRGRGLGEAVLPMLEIARLEVALQHTEEVERQLDEAGRLLLAGPAAPFLQGRLAMVEAMIRLNQGHPQAAVRQLLTTVALLHHLDNPLGEVEARLQLAAILQGGPDHEAASTQRRLALALCVAAREPSSLRDAIDHAVAALTGGLDRQETTRIVACLEQVLPLLAQPDDAVWARVRLADLVGRGLADIPRAESELATALRVAHQAGRRDLEVWIEGRWGTLLMDRASTYQASAVHLRRALELALTLPRPPVDAFDRINWTSPGALCRLLASLSLAQSRSEEAESLLRQALQHDAGEDLAEQRCSDLRTLIQVVLSFQDLEQAERLLDQLLEEIHRLPHPMNRAIWTSIALGPLLGRQGANRLLQIFEDPASPEAADSPARLVLARVARDPARAERIRGACREWIEFSRRRGERVLECTALLVQGAVQDALGQSAEALDSVAQGLDQARRWALKGNLALGHYVTTHVYLREGRWEEAEAAAHRAIKDLSDPTQAREQAFYLAVVASLRLRAHDPRQALAWSAKAVERARASGHGWMIGLALATKGRSQAAQGRLAEALATYQDGVRLLHDQATGRDEGAMTILVARAQRTLGQAQAAMASYRHALDLLRLGDWTMEMRDYTLEAGGYLESLGQGDAALALYQEAIRAVVAWREQLPDRRGQQFLSDQQSSRTLFERAIGLLLARHENAEALRLLELSHSLELLGSANLEHLRADSPHERARLEKLTRLRQDLAALRAQLQGAERSQRPALEQTLATTREQFFATLNDIRRAQADFDQLLTVRATDLAALQKVLEPDTLLVEYFPAEDALYVLLVGRDRFEIRRMEIKRERLAALVQRLRDAWTHAGTSPDGADCRTANATLHEMLVGSLGLGVNPHIRRIVAVPSGFLWHVPLEALRDARGRYLAEDFEVAYLSSADVLNIVQARPARSPAHHLLAVGEPAGTTLPGSRREIETIRALFPGGRTLVGAQATREALVREAPLATLLHVASHSRLDEANPNRSAIELADGVLTLAEVYGLHLPPGSLVVLSSCQSAMGGENPGRDLVSLATAFTSAGASTVVASLWRVDDDATADLMAAFYRALRDGAPRAAALRKAKLHVLSRADRRHPYFWAGFTLMGEPR